MLLKISAKEAYGINMGMTLCQGTDCSVKSSKVGNTEILFSVLKKGKAYNINLDYSHSIVELSSFYDCPHARLTVAMTKVSEAKDFIQE